MRVVGFPKMRQDMRFPKAVSCVRGLNMLCAAQTNEPPLFSGNPKNVAVRSRLGGRKSIDSLRLSISPSAPNEAQQSHITTKAKEVRRRYSTRMLTQDFKSHKFCSDSVTPKAAKHLYRFFFFFFFFIRAHTSRKQGRAPSKKTNGERLPVVCYTMSTICLFAFKKKRLHFFVSREASEIEQVRVVSPPSSPSPTPRPRPRPRPKPLVCSTATAGRRRPFSSFPFFTIVCR